MQLNEKSQIVEELKDGKEKLCEISTQVEYPVSSDPSSQTKDDDVKEGHHVIDTTYSEKVDDALARLDQCKQNANDKYVVSMKCT